MKCSACGAEVAENAIYCHQCGERVDGAGSRPPDETGTGARPEPRDQFQNAAGRRGDEDDDEDEDVLWEGRYSPRDMFGAWILCGLITVAVVALAIWLSTTGRLGWQVIWGSAAVLVLIAWGYPGVKLLYRRMSVSYRLTSQRFFHEAGILRHVTDRIEVIDIDDVACEQSLLQRMFGVGTIHITSSDRSHPELDLPGIENPREVAGKMDDARRKERMRRGLHIESI